MAINKIEMQDTNGNALYPHTTGDLVNYNTTKTVNQKIDEAIANLTSLKAGLTTAVNNKTGSSLTSDSTLADITSKINQIVTLSSGTSDATATASQILSGSTAYVKGTKITGTMTNRGAVTEAINAGGTYTIPAGYHNGSGKVAGNSLASQTNATAVAGQILSGQTAYVNGNKITGTMPNKGSYTDVTSWTPYNSKMFFRFPAGYYSGGSYTNDTQGGAECAIPMATITRDLGITGDKIVSGNTICGVSGTAAVQNVQQYKVTAMNYASGSREWNLSNVWTYPNSVLMAVGTFSVGSTSYSLYITAAFTEYQGVVWRKDSSSYTQIRSNGYYNTGSGTDYNHTPNNGTPYSPANALPIGSNSDFGSGSATNVDITVTCYRF